MKIREDLVLRKVGDTWAVFPIADGLKEYGNIMKLNETGAFLWQLLCNEVSKEELVEALTKEYEIDKKTAEGTVEQYLVKLHEHGIV